VRDRRLPDIWKANRITAVTAASDEAIVGPFPLFPVLAAISLTPTTISVWSAFTVQALLGFLGCRAAADLTMVAGGTPRALTPIGRLGVIWLCAFTPALAWRCRGP
jgi:hypothetical protein